MNHYKQTENPVFWQWLCFSLLLAFNLFQLATHSMWRDELQTWSIVLESSSFTELLFNIRYEGFPLLWYLALWALSIISTAPLTMQLFHFVCSSVAQFLIMKRAPFSGNIRLAIVAGYYISFEYCIISRAYVLGILLIFIFCAFQGWFAERPLLTSSILGLLANTSVYGAIISLVFAGDSLISAYRARNENTVPGRKNPVAVKGFIAIYASLFITAVAIMSPGEGGNYASGWDFTPDLEKLLHTCCRTLISLVPIPEPKITFWNSLAMLDKGPWTAIPASLAVLIAVWLLLQHSKRYLLVFSLGFLGIWMFSALKYSGYVRHTGIIFILLIACLWCAEANPGIRANSSRITHAILWCFLGANLGAWAIASYYHIQYDFSGARKMARVIQQTGENSYPVVADLDGPASAVAAYLGRPFHYVTNRKLQTFIRWNIERDNSGPIKTLQYAKEISLKYDSNLFLLLNYPVTTLNNMRLLALTGNAIVGDEMFYLYEYARVPSPPP